VLGLISWGLGLVGGAIIAREFGRYAKERKISVHYPLVVASAYISLMIWHCGLSGSIPLFIATEGHVFEDVMGVVPFSDTVGSICNLGIVIGLLAAIPFVMASMHPRGGNIVEAPERLVETNEEEAEATEPAPDKRVTWGQRMENSRVLGTVVALLSLGATIWWFFIKGGGMNINSVNMFWLFLASLLHKTPIRLVRSFHIAVKSAAGIILQFPFYAGIMGIVKFSGLATIIAHWFTNIASPATWPTIGLIFSGLMNIFIPSGGGKWVLEAPILIPTSQALGITMEKTAVITMMGDQLTNMVQPFWALPLLGIAHLEAKDILGYTAIAMVFGFLIMALGLTFLPAG
jgi:short-chain fatty acids transporter